MLFIVETSALIGPDLIQDFNPAFALNTTGFGPLDFLIFVVNNIGVFFGLMSVSSGFFMLGTVLIPAFILGLLYVLIEVFRGN